MAAPPLFWVVDATSRASLTTLGRDQGIFQYIAWAIDQGAVDYRDVRDVNGPLTHLVHLVFLKLGGADEHRFRVLDLRVTGFVFALVGACLPGVCRRGRVPLLERAAWAFASWVILSGQLMNYLYWDLAQRETFFNWFMLSAVALQLVAQAALAGERPRWRGWMLPLLGLAGALSAIPWLGKPTYVLFTVVQLLAVLLDDQMRVPRLRAAAAFVVGGAAGLMVPGSFLLLRGDARAFFRIYLVDVPTMYRFMMPRSPVEILSLEWGGTVASLAFVTAAVMLALIYDGQLPRRVLAVALVPLCGLAGVLAQAKGFPYHFHPVTAGLHMQWLLLVVWLWERYRFVPRTRVVARLVPYLAGAALTVKIAHNMPSSPHIQALWILAKADDAEARASRDYLVYFRDRDFFPWEMRQAAEYLRTHTRSTDRVQIYGMDPYVLFLAQRLSATPYVYVYDLNADSALGGSWIPTGLRPNPQEAARIQALRDEHEADLSARLRREPPAAFVFFDKSPLTSNGDSWADFLEHSPETAKWVAAHYRETATFSELHVWLRSDLADAVAAPARDMQ